MSRRKQGPVHRSEAPMLKALNPQGSPGLVVRRAISSLYPQWSMWRGMDYGAPVGGGGRWPCLSLANSVVSNNSQPIWVFFPVWVENINTLAVFKGTWNRAIHRKFLILTHGDCYSRALSTPPLHWASGYLVMKPNSWANSFPKSFPT